MLIQILACLISVILLFLAVLIIRWKVSHRLLLSYGIEGPPTELYYGNARQIQKLGILKFLEINIKKHGDIFGFYCGVQPYIVVKDFEDIKQVLVKQFDNFTNRQFYPELHTKNTSEPRGLFDSRDEVWKRQRKIMSKSFNSVHLRKMSPLVETCCDSLIEKLGEHSTTGKSFDIHKLYNHFALEVILAVGFGHKVDMINGNADKLAESTRAILDSVKGGNQMDGYFLTTLLSNFPFVEGLLRSLFLRSDVCKSYAYTEKKIRELLRERMETGAPDGNYQDLLQLVIDARADSEDEEDKNFAEDPYRIKLTDIEVLKTSIAFLLSGYETTGSALAYVSYLLVLHPEEQENIFEEIDNFFSQKPEATLYEAAQSLNYVNMVMEESLRIYSPLAITFRETSNTTVINGQVFPKNTLVVIPIMAVHHLPEIWSEPSIFRPKRFSKQEKKRHPMAYMPFGLGPRSCIGMRLALTEVKMALIAIMKCYRFIETPDTEKPLQLSVGLTMSPDNGIFLKVERRI